MKNILESLEISIEVEISEAHEPLSEIIKAVEDKYPEYRFSRTESRYESCTMAVFEKR